MDGLDRSQDYRLWFDHVAFRWEIQQVPEWAQPPKPGAGDDPSEAGEPGNGPGGVATGPCWQHLRWPDPIRA